MKKIVGGIIFGTALFSIFATVIFGIMFLETGNFDYLLVALGLFFVFCIDAGFMAMADINAKSGGK